MFSIAFVDIGSKILHKLVDFSGTSHDVDILHLDHPMLSDPVV